LLSRQMPCQCWPPSFSPLSSPYPPPFTYKLWSTFI
jgi:hypothetical protein